MERNIKYIVKLLEAINSINNIPQYPNFGEDRTELIIWKNDPKNWSNDYWFLYYGDISISKCNNISDLIIRFSEELNIINSLPPELSEDNQ